MGASHRKQLWARPCQVLAAFAPASAGREDFGTGQRSAGGCRHLRIGCVLPAMWLDRFFHLKMFLPMENPVFFIHQSLLAGKWVGLSASGGGGLLQFWSMLKCQSPGKVLGSTLSPAHTLPTTQTVGLGFSSAGLPRCHDNCSIPAWQGWEISAMPTIALPRLGSGYLHRQLPHPKTQLPAQGATDSTPSPPMSVRCCLH